jgi:hypothetical protein
VHSFGFVETFRTPKTGALEHGEIALEIGLKLEGGFPKAALFSRGYRSSLEPPRPARGQKENEPVGPSRLRRSRTRRQRC